MKKTILKREEGKGKVCHDSGECTGIDEISILIRDDAGFGYGAVRCVEANTDNQEKKIVFISEKYQEHISDASEDDADIFMQLGEGKLYEREYAALIDAVNDVLKFWHAEQLNKLNQIPTIDCIKDASDLLSKDASNPYLIYN